MDESFRCSDQSPIRQGDIFVFDGPDRSAPEYGVVINADCDLAHGKIDGVIAFLPVYPFRSYLERFWLPSHLDGELNASLKWIADLCSLSPAEIDDLKRWILNDTPVKVASGLMTTIPLPAKKLPELERHLNRTSMLLAQKGLPAFRQLCLNDSSYARKHLESAKKNLGEGHFFITEISGQDGLGYVIRMRRIITLDAASCFASVAEMRSSSDRDQLCCARVARLSPAYQYRISQLFAYQYSRIGLPDETTALGSLAIDDLVSELSNA